MAVAEAPHRLVGGQPSELAADEAGERSAGERGVTQADMLHLGKAVLQPGCEGVDTRPHARRADRALELERLGERPAVLEGVEASRRHRAADRRAARSSKEGSSAPARLQSRGPRRAGAARAEEPLVTAGDEEVAPELAGRTSSTPKP